MLALRPHHLLCLRYYRGKGYSAAFCANMNAICRRLHDRPDTVIQLHCGADSICRACPHLRQDGLCETQEKTADLDRRVLAELALPANARLRWEAFSRFPLQAALCSGCSWQDFCLSIEKENALSGEKT